MRKLYIHLFIKDMFVIMLKLIRISYYLHCEMLIPIVLFANKTVYQHVNLLNDIILNVLKNFARNKFIMCNDRYPPWVNNVFIIKWRNITYKSYDRNGK